MLTYSSLWHFHQIWKKKKKKKPEKWALHKLNKNQNIPDYNACPVFVLGKQKWSKILLLHCDRWRKMNSKQLMTLPTGVEVPKHLSPDPFKKNSLHQTLMLIFGGQLRYTISSILKKKTSQQRDITRQMQHLHPMLINHKRSILFHDHT